MAFPSQSLSHLPPGFHSQEGDASGRVAESPLDLSPEVGPPSVQASWRQGVQALGESLFPDRDCEGAESRGETVGVQLGEDKDFRDVC